MRAMAVIKYTVPLELPIPEVKPGFASIRILIGGVCYSDFKTTSFSEVIE
jgi:D-arabinose 1-dehydrogenase-like Zn-dependent alcohol dehydrogenase